MDSKYFYHSQAKWIEDDSPLKIMEKSRQVGATHCSDYRTALLASQPKRHRNRSADKGRDKGCDKGVPMPCGSI